MLPDPILAVLAIVGLFVYASIAVAVAKTGKSRYYLRDWVLMRWSTTAVVAAVWAFSIWWGFHSTFNGGKNGDISTFNCFVIFGGLVAAVGLMILTWMPAADEQRVAFAVVWPLALIAGVVGCVVRFLGLQIAKLPNTVGTYVAEVVNETRGKAA